MTVECLKEALALIENYFGRPLSTDERTARSQIYAAALKDIPDDVAAAALTKALTVCRYQNQLLVDWCAEIRKLQSAGRPTANDLWTQAIVAARKIERNQYYALFGKIKNIFKNMHSYYCQFFFRELIESGRLNAIGGKMPEIPETEAEEHNLPPEAEPLEEVDAEELDDAEEPAADELTKATEIARQNGGVTQAMLEQQMGVTAEKAIALLDDMESAGVIEFSNGHYTIAAADSEEE